MKNVKNDLINSFKGNDLGFSLKKIVASVLIITVVVVHVKWINIGNLDELESVLLIDYGFIAGLLGMSTYQNIQKYGAIENQKKDPNEGP